MPGYKAHLVGGAAAGGVTLSLLTCLHVINPSPLWAVELLMASIAGSLFPDVDIKSKGQKFYYRILFCFFVYLFVRQKLFILGLFSMIALIPLLVRHRGIFHRWWFVLFVPLSIAFLCGVQYPHMRTTFYFDALFFAVGALSHICLDMGLKRTFRW